MYSFSSFGALLGGGGGKTKFCGQKFYGHPNFSEKWGHSSSGVSLGRGCLCIPKNHNRKSLRFQIGTLTAGYAGKPQKLGVPKPGCFKPGCLQFFRGSALLRSFVPFCALALLRSFAPFSALLRTCVCALLRSFALICVFLRQTAFRATAFGKCRFTPPQASIQGFARGGCFPKVWFWQMFPGPKTPEQLYKKRNDSTKNRNEGTKKRNDGTRNRTLTELKRSLEPPQFWPPKKTPSE